MFRKTKRLLSDFGPTIMGVTIAVAIFGAIVLPKLGGLLKTSSEKAQYIGVASGNDLVNNALYLPQKLPQYALHKIDEGNVTLLRIISVATLFVATLAIFTVLSKWHTRRLAVAGIVLFITSTYTLLIGRSASSTVLYLAAIPLLLLIGTWLKSKRNVGKFPIATAIIAGLLYVPSVWIFIFFTSMFFHKRLILAWKVIGRSSKIASILIFGILLVPLAISFFKDPILIINWLGVDRDLTISIAWSNFIDIVPSIFWHGPSGVLWVRATPMMDIFTLSMFTLGTVAYATGHHPLRGRLLLGYGVLSIIVISLGIVPEAIVIPLIYIVATNGIAKMLQSWFVVFPRNPFARGVGVALLAIAVLMSSRYQLIRYYDALPVVDRQSTVTKVIQ